MTPLSAGTTLRAVPDPAIEIRRATARQMQANGLSHTEIANRLGVARHIVKEDLRPTKKPAPPSYRLPADLVDQIRDEAAKDGISASQVVVRALRHWFKERARREAWSAEKRERRARGEKGL